MTALVVMACVGYNVPTNGAVRVYDLGHIPASVQWQMPGFLGTPFLGGSDTRSLAPCTNNTWFFARGDHVITIATATDRVAFVLHAAPDGQPTVLVVYAIDARGHIDLLSHDPIPEPTCPP